MELLNIFPLDIVDQVTAPNDLTSAVQLKLVGGNYGNLAFRHGAVKGIAGLFVPWSLSDDKSLPLVVTAANWLDGKSAPVNTDLLSAMRLARRAVIFGLGAQAPTGMELGDFVGRMEPDSIDRLRELSGYVTTIGVRDHFTRDVLAAVGVHNTEVLGCLSNFINPDPLLGDRLLARCQAQSGPTRIAVTEHTLNTRSRTQSKQALLKTLALVEQLDASYVLQGRHQIPLLRRESDDIHATFNDLLDAESNLRLRHVIGTRARYFTRVPDWLDFYGTRDLVLGSRVHGAILGCQAGVPSILVTHDRRTAGLAEVMGLPCMDQDAFMGWDGDLAVMFDIVRKAARQYDQKRVALAGSWSHFFSSQGFSVGTSLAGILSVQGASTASPA